MERAASHPKMEALLSVVLQHFKPQDSLTTAAAGEPTAAEAANLGHAAQEDQPGRVIIFTNRRDSVQSIVDMLRSQEPIVTAR